MQTASKKREKGRESSHICCLRVVEQEAGFCVVLFSRVTARCSLVHLAPGELLPLRVTLPPNPRLLLHPPDRDKRPSSYRFTGLFPATTTSSVCVCVSVCVSVCVCVCVCTRTCVHVPCARLCRILCDLWTVGSSVHGMLQARTLERVAISSSRGSSPHRD